MRAKPGYYIVAAVRSDVTALLAVTEAASCDNLDTLVADEEYAHITAVRLLPHVADASRPLHRIRVLEVDLPRRRVLAIPALPHCFWSLRKAKRAQEFTPALCMRRIVATRRPILGHAFVDRSRSMVSSKQLTVEFVVKLDLFLGIFRLVILGQLIFAQKFLPVLAVLLPHSLLSIIGSFSSFKMAKYA